MIQFETGTPYAHLSWKTREQISRDITKDNLSRNKTTAEYFEQKAFRISPEEQRIEFE